MQNNSEKEFKINQAVNFHKKRDFINAKAIYQELINTFPEDFLPWFLMGSLEIDLANYDKAIENLNASHRLNSEYLDTYINLGFCHYITNQHIEAISVYTNATKLNSFDLKNKTHEQLMRRLARTYIEMGDKVNAVKIYKRLSKSDPENLYYVYILNDLKSIELSDLLRKKITKLLNKKNDLYTQEVYAHLLLAKYEKISKDYENELAHLKKAHNVLYNHNVNSYEETTEFYFNTLGDLDKSYRDDVMIDFKLNERKKLKPIFIVGLPRSGSTLLEKIILNSDQVVAGEETSIMQILFNEIKNDEYFYNNIDYTTSRIISFYEKRKLINFEKKYNFTDKSLENFFCLGWIKKIFPNAKIINIQRDPMASIVSILRNNLFESTWAHRIEDICKYVDTYYSLLNRWEKEFNIPIYSIKYENLISDFDNETKKLFKYCDLDWQPNLRAINNKSVISKTYSMIQIREPIYNKVDTEYLELANLLRKYTEKYQWSNNYNNS